MSDESLQVFADEAEDLLNSAEQALLSLDDIVSTADSQDCINDLFRTFHTIKGAAGLFGLDSVVNFTHIVESLLVKIREGVVPVDEKIIGLFLASNDHLARLVDCVLAGTEGVDEVLQKVNNNLVESLNSYLNVDSNEPETAIMKSEQVPTLAVLDGGVESDNWHISLRFGLNVLRNGMEPASFIDYLNTIGQLVSVNLIDDALPAWDCFEPENCYLGFEIVLNAPTATKEIIQSVFEFVQDECTISILPPHSHITAYIKMIEDLPEDELRIGDILVSCGALTESEKHDILNVQDKLIDQITASGVKQSVLPLGKVAVEQQVVQQEVVDAALKKQQNEKQQRVKAQQTIRVNALKLESLVDLVGELVIGSANAELNARKQSDAVLNEAMENLLRLVEEVRDTALGLRMVQIGETFNKFKRVVRDVSSEIGKEIELQISGAETELDKTLIEKIGDPLMHLVRNAVDHGIETPTKRIELGKSQKGIINLDAFHDSGSIVIRVSDDGAGLSKDKIVKKALEKGLIQENQQLSEQEILRLIFHAGFSTADKVSNLSGRGVGMDVVRSNIEALRGQVDIDSEQGKGTTISIRLPLTLAIIDGFQVRVDESQYILPLNLVEECIELNESLRSNDEHANYLNLRGEILPFVYLSELFGSSVKKNDLQRDNIVVVQCAGKKVGFVVDELLGEHQTVIKPLGKIFENLIGISGATILGSGEVAMIIDIPEMIKRVISTQSDQSDYSNTVH